MYNLLEENRRKPPGKARYISKLYGVIVTLLATLVIYGLVRFNAFASKALTLTGAEPDAPLILTTLIERSSAMEAREAAKVQHTSFGNTRSFSGFLTVNGLFREHGPFKLTDNYTIINNKFSWTRNNNMLYIDNPVGTGYSYTNSNMYDRDEQQIALELLEAITQFFILFPELKDNKFFIAGESYAGKYVPSVAYEIMKRNLKLKDETKINLQGLAIGNGKIDPVNQLDFGEFAFQHGLVDSNTKTKMNQMKDKIVVLLQEKKFKEASDIYYQMIDLFEKQTGFDNLFNYLYPNRLTHLKDVEAFVQRNDIRKAIHVGSNKFRYGDEVSQALEMDSMKSVAALLPPLLENYRMLFYNGQLDARLPYSCMVNFLEKLKFNSADEYKKAERKIWRVDGQIAGYSKVAGNMTELLVRDAGHMVPVDQPEWAFDMITRFTRDKGFE